MSTEQTFDFILRKRNRLCYTAGVGRNPWPQICTLLRNRSRDSRSFHFTFVVNYHASIILEVYKHSVLPAKWFPLPYDHCGHHCNKHQYACSLSRMISKKEATTKSYFKKNHSFTLFPKFRLALLNSGDNHIARSSSGQAVQPTLDSLHCDDIQVLST